MTYGQGYAVLSGCEEPSTQHILTIARPDQRLVGQGAVFHIGSRTLKDDQGARDKCLPVGRVADHHKGRLIRHVDRAIPSRRSRCRCHHSPPRGTAYRPRPPMNSPQPRKPCRSDDPPAAPSWFRRRCCRARNSSAPSPSASLPVQVMVWVEPAGQVAAPVGPVICTSARGR